MAELKTKLHNFSAVTLEITDESG